MKTARMVLIVACVAALVAAAAAPALAAESGTVTAHVDVEQISCAVSPTTLDFGLAPLGLEVGTTVVRVTNDGNGPEDIMVSGTDASNGAAGTWALVTTGPLAADQFGSRWEGGNIGVQAIGTVADQKIDNLAPTTYLEGVMTIDTPPSTTQMGTYSWTVTFTAVAG